MVDNVLGIHRPFRASFRPVASNTLLVAFGKQVLDLPALSGSVDEVREISSVYGPGSIVLVGEDASVNKLMRNLPRSSLLHISTHSFLDGRTPFGGSLVLGDSRGGSEQWNAVQIQQLRLDRLRLVVLAACDTATGSDPATGTSFSLAGAFLEAGAGQALAALWPLSDRAAAKLMPIFHRSLLSSGDALAALRETQREGIAMGMGADAAALTIVSGPNRTQPPSRETKGHSK
jgi:CHAT domain-containing protein